MHSRSHATCLGIRWIIDYKGISFPNLLGCEDTSIGVEARGIIPDSSFTASSIFNNGLSKPYFARFGDTRGYGWCPSSPQNDNTNYLQIDLGAEYVVCAIATKAGWYDKYVKTYKITMSNDKQNWKTYEEGGRQKVRYLFTLVYLHAKDREMVKISGTHKGIELCNHCTMLPNNKN